LQCRKLAQLGRACSRSSPWPTLPIASVAQHGFNDNNLFPVAVCSPGSTDPLVPVRSVPVEEQEPVGATSESVHYKSDAFQKLPGPDSPAFRDPIFATATTGKSRFATTLWVTRYPSGTGPKV